MEKTGKKFLSTLFAFAIMIFLSTGARADILNPGFETGDLSDWASSGQAGVQSDIVYSDSYAAWIGTVDFNHDNYNDLTGDFPTDSLYDHSISQDFTTAGLSTLEFWYNVYTFEDNNYDQPAFGVFLDGTSIFSLNAGDIGFPTSTTPVSTGWTSFTYDLSTPGSHTLTIYAGNTDDVFDQSWAYIDDVHVTAAPVPVPAAIWLLGSGLLGLLGFMRKQEA